MGKDVEGNGTGSLLSSDEVIVNVFDDLAKTASRHVFWGELIGIGIEIDEKNEKEDGLFFESFEEMNKTLTLYRHIVILLASDKSDRYMISLGVSQGKYPRNIAVMQVAKRILRQDSGGVVGHFENTINNRNTSEVSIIASTKRDEIVFFEKPGNAGEQDYSGFGKEHREQKGWHPNVVSALKKQIEKIL